MNDTIIEHLIALETTRQQDTLMLIPSENYISSDVEKAIGSCLSNKYAEGYPKKRYYEGNQVVDLIEQLAIDRAKALFKVPFVNVQPYSGSPANSAIYFALCKPNDVIMGLSLSAGGHLTHGHAKVTFSGTYFRSVQYGLGKDGHIDYEECERLAKEYKPTVIVIGTTAYPFELDFKRCADIANSVGAYLVADISHIVGLIIAGVHPSPFEYAHVVMTTTHKTLRGPRGAMIMVTDTGLKKDKELPKKIDTAVFPGLQGGPHLNTIAGIAVALEEASKPEYIEYGKQVIKNALTLSKSLQKNGVNLVGNGTQNHLMIMDFSSEGAGKGTLVAKALNTAGIVTNKNTVPYDLSPFYPSGVRLGTPAVSTRGMKEDQMERIAQWIGQVIFVIQNERLPEEKSLRQSFLLDFEERIDNSPQLQNIAQEVRLLCSNFPMNSLKGGI